MTKKTAIILTILFLTILILSLMSCKNFFSSVFNEKKTITITSITEEFTIGFPINIKWESTGYIPAVDIEVYLNEEDAKQGINPILDYPVAKDYENNMNFEWDTLYDLLPTDNNDNVNMRYYDKIFEDGSESEIYIKVMGSGYPSVAGISKGVTINNDHVLRGFLKDYPEDVGEGSVVEVTLLPVDQYRNRIEPSNNDNLNEIEVSVDLSFINEDGISGSIPRGYKWRALRYKSEGDKESCYIVAGSDNEEDYVECKISFRVSIDEETDGNVVYNNSILMNVTNQEMKSFSDSIGLFDIYRQPEFGEDFEFFINLEQPYIEDDYISWNEPSSLEVDQYEIFKIRVKALDNLGGYYTKFDFEKWLLAFEENGIHPFNMSEMDKYVYVFSVEKGKNNIYIEYSMVILDAHDNSEPEDLFIEFNYTDNNVYHYQSSKIIVNDRAGPYVNTVNINNDDYYTDSLNVNITASGIYDYTDGTIQYRISNSIDGFPFVWNDIPSGNTSISDTATLVKPSTADLTESFIYIQFRDSLGNISHAYSDSIMLEYGVIYVSKDDYSTGSADGSRENPYGDINTALANISAYSSDVTPKIKVANTTNPNGYEEHLDLSSDVILEGGYLFDGVETWQRFSDLENNLTKVYYQDTITGGSNIASTIKINSDSTVDGFYVTGYGSSNNYAVVWVTGNFSPTISHCSIIGDQTNPVYNAYGMINDNGASPLITDNYLIKSGISNTNSAGIYNNGAGSVTVQNNKGVKGSTSNSKSYGIWNVNSSTILIQDNLSDGSEDSGIKGGSAPNSYGIKDYDSTDLSIINNALIHGGNSTSLAGEDGAFAIYCDYSSLTITNNAINGGSGLYKSIGIGLYTNSTGDISLNNITGGTGDSEAYGIYNEGDNPDIINNTIVGGLISGGTAYAIYNNSSSAYIYGNSIRGGNSDFTYAISNNNSSFPAIDNNKIYGGKSTYSTGSTTGIYCSGSSSPVITNNDIHGGDSVYRSYGLNIAFSSPIIINNAIHGGYTSSSDSMSSSIAIRNINSSAPYIINNTMDGGIGTYASYGISNISNSTPYIINNIILNSGTSLTHGIYNNISTPATVSYNCIYIANGDSGTSYISSDNNIDNNPSIDLTTDSDADDFYDWMSGYTLIDVLIAEGGEINSHPDFPQDTGGNKTDKAGTLRTGNTSTGWSMGAYEIDIP